MKKQQTLAFRNLLLITRPPTISLLLLVPLSCLVYCSLASHFEWQEATHFIAPVASESSHLNQLSRKDSSKSGAQKQHHPPVTSASDVSKYLNANKISPFWDIEDAPLLRANGCKPDPKKPDISRNASQIIASRGYEVQDYDVITPDGYILAIQRVINPLVSEYWRSRKRPVILQHGVLSSSIDWLINSSIRDRPRPFPLPASVRHEQIEPGPNSLAFYLANRGHDVWLANSRGNFYGQRHVNLTSSDPRFWSFTFDEHIAFDLPATITFVQRVTKRTKLAYVGHSQGAELVLGLLSEQPDYADILEPVIALAPVAFASNALTPIRRLHFLTPLAQNINAPFAADRRLINYLAGEVCDLSKLIRREICANILFLVVGFNERELDESRLTAYLCHMPSGTSLKNIAHYGQGIRSGRFAHFDHGPANNEVRYGRRLPPDYKLSRIRSNSLTIFFADNDWLASPLDVTKLLQSLQVKPVAVVNMSKLEPAWNHIDFLYAKRTGELINPHVTKLLANFY